MTLDDLLRLVPVVFHVTREANVPGIVARERLLSPSEVQRLHGTHAPHTLRRSRNGTIRHLVPLSGTPVYLSDHDRLHEGNIRFEDGWNMSRLLELLDGLVFFWPGGERGPNSHGTAHRDRYAREGTSLTVLRAPLADVVALHGPPRLSSCNSGAPRYNPKSGAQPRGSRTFRALEVFSAGEEVVEVVFEREVQLPRSTQRAPSYGGPWEPLFPP